MKISLFAVALCAAMSAYALDPIVIKGSKFFNKKTGEQFFFKGVAYQPRQGVPDSNLDPLADTAGCKRDIEKFKDLGINSIRVYQVDYKKNHDECMKMLEDAGIYVMMDVPSPKYSINRNQPYWDHDMFSHWTAKIDAFSKYSNLVAWIAGNEVANSVDTTSSAAFVKAALRDVKAYLKKKGLDTPVGYADNDDMDIRMNLINYFNCGDKETRADFYGINIYRWCGDETNFKTSGYEAVTKNMTGYSIPSLLTEHGCNKNRPRTFPEVKSLYGSDMDSTFSGGIMYEYSEEDNKYGIVKVSYGDSKIEKTMDYDNFKKALADAKPTKIKMDDYKPSGEASTCPKASGDWHVKPGNLPPTPSVDRCKCMMDTLGCTFKSDKLSPSEGKAVGKAVGNICGQSPCSKISYSTEKGQYGDYIACDPSQRSAWAINKSYLDQSKAKCKVDGVDLKEVKSPKEDDEEVCLKKKDDIGNASSSNGNNNPDDNDNNEDGEDKDDTTGTSSSAQPLIQPLAFVGSLAALVSFVM